MPCLALIQKDLIGKDKNANIFTCRVRGIVDA